MFPVKRFRWLSFNFQLKLVISARVDLTVCSYHVTYVLRLNLYFAISCISKNYLLKTGAITEILLTAKDSNPPLGSQSNLQPFSKKFIYELSGCGFESRCRRLVLSLNRVLLRSCTTSQNTVNRSFSYAKLWWTCWIQLRWIDLL